MLLLGCHVRPGSVPAGPAFLRRLWQESSSLSSRSFSAIHFFSWARVSNFSCRKSLVLPYNKFWVRWSLRCQIRDEVLKEACFSCRSSIRSEQLKMETHLSFSAVIRSWSLRCCAWASSVLIRRSSSRDSTCSLARRVCSSIWACRASTWTHEPQK